jgi:hypothetical protein
MLMLDPSLSMNLTFTEYTSHAARWAAVRVFVQAFMMPLKTFRRACWPGEFGFVGIERALMYMPPWFWA